MLLSQMLNVKEQLNNRYMSARILPKSVTKFNIDEVIVL